MEFVRLYTITNGEGIADDIMGGPRLRQTMSVAANGRSADPYFVLLLLNCTP